MTAEHFHIHDDVDFSSGNMYAKGFIVLAITVLWNIEEG